MSDFAKNANANANCGMWAPLDRYNFTRLDSFIKSGMGESSTTPLMEGLRQELFYEAILALVWI
jgi:hypothetical protein